MLARLSIALLACVVSPADAQATAFWLQHIARPALTQSELARAFWRG